MALAAENSGAAARRARFLPFAILLASLALAACASRPGPEALREVAAAAPGARQVTIYVATTRQRETPDANVFTDGRAEGMAYAEFTISIPPGHKPGNIEWPGAAPDPNAAFVTVRQRALDRPAFEAEVSRTRGGRRADVGVFVHGYNTNFQEALFRMAQMTADADADAEGAPILFAWPSKGRLIDYIADRDAVIFSRDQLAALLTMLAQKPEIGRITLIGHSLGGWLAAEAVRQLRLAGRDAVIRRLHVVLAAPDIDVDVFRAQLAVIGPLAPPLTLLVARNDTALWLSHLIAGERQRLGAVDVSDPRAAEAARKAKVQVIDISNLPAADAFGHDRFVALAALYPKLAAEETSGRGADLRRSGVFVFDAIGATLASPFTLAGRALAGE